MTISAKSVPEYRLRIPFFVDAFNFISSVMSSDEDFAAYKEYEDQLYQEESSSGLVDHI